MPKDEVKETEQQEHDDKGKVVVEADDEEQEGEASTGKRKRKRKRKKKASKQEEEEEEYAASEENTTEEGATKDLSTLTVYVEGIPFDVKPDQVKEFFVSHGVSDVVELARFGTVDRIWTRTTRFPRSAYEKALTLSRKHMGKRYLTIVAANSTSRSRTTTRQGLQNLVCQQLDL